jgi:hypothetical protein
VKGATGNQQAREIDLVPFLPSFESGVAAACKDYDIVSKHRSCTQREKRRESTVTAKAAVLGHAVGIR